MLLQNRVTKRPLLTGLFNFLNPVRVAVGALQIPPKNEKNVENNVETYRDHFARASVHIFIHLFVVVVGFLNKKTKNTRLTLLVWEYVGAPQLRAVFSQLRVLGNQQDWETI